MLSNDEILNTHIDLLDIYFQLEAFDTYVKHLESHLIWPQKIEEQNISAVPDPYEYMAAMDDIEYKYSIVLPIRQRFSYVLQFTSIMEWGLQRILDHHDIPYKSKLKKRGRSKLEILFELLESERNITIPNKQELISLYKFRNQVVHSDGIVPEQDLEKFSDSYQYTLKEAFGERYLFLDMTNFIKCIETTRGWLASATAFRK